MKLWSKMYIEKYIRIKKNIVQQNPDAKPADVLG